MVSSGINALYSVRESEETTDIAFASMYSDKSPVLVVSPTVVYKAVYTRPMTATAVNPASDILFIMSVLLIYYSL